MINKGRFHPSRISNRQKLLRARDVDKIFPKTKSKSKLESIDISKSDWSQKK